MFYAVFIPPTCVLPADLEERPPPEALIFTDIKEASSALKQFKGSRMKTFEEKEQAIDFINNADKDESFIEPAEPNSRQLDLVDALERLSIDKKPEETTTKEFPSLGTAQLSQLKRHIEKDECKKVEELIMSNPRFLIDVCDSAVLLMAGPRYNACHIAARANRSDMMALLLGTVSKISFIKKLYPNEPDDNVQDRRNHLLDSYLNTPDKHQGSTPLHFACKKGYFKVVEVLLTFGDCRLNLKDKGGKTAEESICLQWGGEKDLEFVRSKIKSMFKSQLGSPARIDQLNKQIKLAKRWEEAMTRGDYDPQEMYDYHPGK